jgi:hypothetical protein
MLTDSELRAFIHEERLIGALLDDTLRSQLLGYLGGRSQEVRSFLELAVVVAKSCHATTSQLSDAVAKLEADGSDVARDLLWSLSDHAEIHADIRLRVRGRS